MILDELEEDPEEDPMEYQDDEAVDHHQYVRPFMTNTLIRIDSGIGDSSKMASSTHNSAESWSLKRVNFDITIFGVCRGSVVVFTYCSWFTYNSQYYDIVLVSYYEYVNVRKEHHSRWHCTIAAYPPPGFQTTSVSDDEQMMGANSGSRRSREDYEDTTFSQSQPMSKPDGYFSNTPTQSFTSPSSSKRPTRREVSELHSKKCETIDKLNESLQGKIDRTGQKATKSIERCVDELTKFKDLLDCVFTIALEHFHSHSTRTIFLWLDDENKLRWLYSLGKTMASASEGAANETNSSSGTPGTPQGSRWEGSAADARVLNHVVSQDPIFPFPPIGKYYLVDAGFTNYQCFLAPYRGDAELPSSAPSGFSYRLLYTSQHRPHGISQILGAIWISKGGPLDIER
ncbi:UNVERIFIED_CONTAM: hypothetical protein Scaly_2208400 [Sesamum calycinum]|uniref:DDE Tnp4 domain-containing protein n=1 Tax=Sesamum calycinum TaxID=2727403 RepID=A0AAW2MQP1_9LAMI